MKWPDWLKEQEMALPLVGKYLKNSAITEVSGNRVLLALDPRFSEYIAMLEEVGSRKKIEKCIGKLLGGTVNIKLSVWDIPPAGCGEEQEEEEPAEVEEEGPLVSSAQTEAPKTFHEWSKDPVVKKTLEIFNADILEIKDPS